MKKLLCLLCTLILALSCTTTAFACTPIYKAPDIPKVPDIEVELSDDMKDAVNKAVQKQLEKMILDRPDVAVASYWQKETIRGAYSVLTVGWNEIEGATSYKVRVTKEDGTSKTYESKYNILTKYGTIDEFIAEGMDGATVEVRAYGENETYSMWSEKKTVSKGNVY
ncbi:hypothetical protein [Sporofaciens sp. SGI.106]|uniref:hypothetical protein n=1 Tax=Sporofaciens sp. SGI.106 TaxID=3420568 RepID=UPI003CFE4A6C